MKKINVIHLNESMITAGAEKIIESIVVNLDHDKFSVAVWCFTELGEIGEALKKRGADIRVLGITSYFNPKNILRLSRLFREAKPDIIHTHTYFSNTIGRLAAVLAGVPIKITHVHNTYWHYSKKNLFVERILSHWTDKIVCCSEAVRDFVLKQEKIPARNVITILNGIAIDEFNKTSPANVDLKNSLGIGSADPVLISVASLTSKKGHKYLIESLTDIVKTYPNLKCLIIGTGDLENSLKKQVKQNNLNKHVIFTGVRDDITPLLSISDIFVLPSIIEGLGISAIEAMANELPVVATTVGGLPEVVEQGISGRLVPPQNAGALSSAIKSLLCDPAESRRMGHEGRKIVQERFHRDAMIKAFEKMYDELVQEKILKNIA